MNFLKIKLFLIAAIVFAASSAFASLSYDVTIDTTSLNNTDGYLYLQYIPVANAVSSTATVSGFLTNGTLGSQSLNVVNGAAVAGALPGTVTFANTNGINDYNHAIHFGTSMSFSLLLDSANFSTPSVGSSTFSLGLFGDEFGAAPLVTGDGTMLAVSLFNDGTAQVTPMDATAQATPTPIPAAAWLLGSGLMGLVGLRRKGQKA